MRFISYDCVRFNFPFNKGTLENEEKKKNSREVIIDK